MRGVERRREAKSQRMQYYRTVIINREQEPALRIQQEKLPGVDAAIAREKKRKGCVQRSLKSSQTWYQLGRVAR